MATTPRVRQNPPREVDPEVLAARRAEVAEMRKRLADERAAGEPAKRAALEAGPPLRDVDAAVECGCTCHPRPACSGLHEGGSACPCQLPAEERRAAFDALLATLGESIDEEISISDERDRRTDEAARRLGVEVGELGGAAPFVIRGVVDGRGFYLRERHERWRVEIAPDDTPGADPIETEVSIVVAEGSDDEFMVDGRFDEVRALEVSVGAVRVFMLRRSCEHVGAQRFCPDCGAEAVEFDRWRVEAFAGDDPKLAG
jgi:hypothetical protein